MTTQSQPRRMTVAQFLAWASAQPRGRYELVRGEAVPIAPERALHNRVKAAVIRALEDAISGAGLPCIAYTDGMTAVIDDDHAREPDAAVQCGVAFDPGRRGHVAVDTGEKLADYFSVPSIRHYLIINPVEKIVIHHARNAAGDRSRRVLTGGAVDLTPPGMTVPVAALLPNLG